jgi:hypothetical protein
MQLVVHFFALARIGKHHLAARSGNPGNWKPVRTRPAAQAAPDEYQSEHRGILFEFQMISNKVMRRSECI